MTVRIPWNENEEALLLNALIKVRNQEIERKRAIEEVSLQLRKMALAHGIVIDEKFRNENGIALQMSKLEYVYTNGESGLHVDSGWYFSIVQTYRNDYKKYLDLLGETMEMISTELEDKKNFSDWVKENNPEQAERILSTINTMSILLLKNRIIRSKINHILDVKEIESLINQIKSNKRIKIHSGKMKASFIKALGAYSDYLQYLNKKVIEDTHNQQASDEDSKRQLVVDDTEADEIDEREKSEIKRQDLEGYKAEGISFYDWLVQKQGMAVGTGRSYDSAINTADTFVREHNIGHGVLRGTDDYIIISETTDALFQTDDFIELNQQQHNRFRAALRKYLQFIRGDGTVEERQSAVVTKKTFENEDLTPYRNILSEKFPKGFRIDSRLDMGRLRAFWNTKYESELIEEDEIIRQRIASITVRCQDFVYLPETMASEQTTQRLLSYLTDCFKSGKNAVYFDALYKEFQLEFSGKRINNPEMLKNYLKFINDGSFYIHKNYLTAKADAEVNPADEVRNYLITIGVPIALEDLKDALSHLNENDVFWAVAGRNSAEFVRNQKGEYFHADIIHFTQQEIDIITELIQSSIDDKEYMGGKELTDAVEVRLPSVIERYPFLTWLGLRDVIAYKLQDVFSFKGKIISAHGQDLSMSDVFAYFAATHDYFTLEQLNSLKRDLDTPIYFDSIYDNSLRINKDEFVSRDQASFDIEAIDAAISRFCTGDYIVLKEINFFGSFPDAGFLWNGFLLEHYVADFSKRFKLLHVGFNASTPVGAIVKRSSHFDNFDELVSKELANSMIPLSRDNALQYLVDIGLLARRNYSGIEQTLLRAKLQRSKKG